MGSVILRDATSFSIKVNSCVLGTIKGIQKAFCIPFSVGFATIKMRKTRRVPLALNFALGHMEMIEAKHRLMPAICIDRHVKHNALQTVVADLIRH